MNNLLECKNLTREFQQGKGAIDINLDISKGEIVGFLGPNGSGKTTTIKMIMGLLNKDRGEIKLFGEEVKSFSDFPKIYHKIGYLPSEPAYYDDLTAREMFKYALKFRSSTKELVEDYSKRLSLDLDKKISKLSLGNKRKVGVILSILGNPDLIIMDEPTSGLDPLIQREVLEILKECSSNGAGIFLSSHNLAEIENVCDRVVVIKDAKIIYKGTIREIKSKKQKKVEFMVKDKSQL